MELKNSLAQGEACNHVMIDTRHNNKKSKIMRPISSAFGTVIPQPLVVNLKRTPSELDFPSTSKSSLVSFIVVGSG